MQQKNQQDHPNLAELRQIVGSLYRYSSQKLFLNFKSYHWKSVLNYQTWNTLKHLYLYECQITYKDVPIITNINFHNLIQLSLACNPIGSNGLKKLIKADFPNLQTIWLMQCNIGDQGAKHLSKVYMPKLSSISIENNRIQSDGCLGLLRLQKCQQYHRSVDYINMNIFVAAQITTIKGIQYNWTNVALQVMCQDCISRKQK